MNKIYSIIYRCFLKRPIWLQVHILPLVTLIVIAVTFSCATQNKAKNLSKQSMSVELLLSNDIELQKEESIKISDAKVNPDTLTVKDDSGKEIYIMKAIQNEAGEMVATDVLSASYITARFRNVAERHGKVEIAFQIVVQEAMQDSKWQLRFYPEMFIQEDSVSLEPVVIT